MTHESPGNAPWWKGFALPIATLEGGTRVFRGVAPPPEEDGYLAYLNRMIELDPSEHGYLFYVQREGKDEPVLAVRIEGSSGFVNDLKTPFSLTPNRPESSDFLKATLWICHDVFKAKNFFQKGDFSVWARRLLHLPRGASGPTPAEAISKSKEAWEHREDPWKAARLTKSMLDILHQAGILRPAEVIDGDYDEEYISWGFAAGSQDYHLIQEEGYDYSMGWMLEDGSGRVLTSEKESPLEALQSLPVWWPSNDLEGYLERTIPQFEWEPGLHEAIEVFLLLGEQPLLWEADQLKTFAEEAGLI